MSLQFSEIIEQASELIVDTDHTLFPGGLTAKKAAVNRVQRRLLLLTKMNRAGIVVSFATNVASGVVEANTHTNDPTVIRKDMNGWNEYEVLDMYLLDEVERFLTTSDGRETKLVKWTPQKAHDDYWISPSADRVIGYRMSTTRRIRFYPNLTADGYPHTVEIRYRKLAKDMTLDADVPSMPEAFSDALTYAVAAEWSSVMGRKDAALHWDRILRDYVGIGILEKNDDDLDQPVEIQETWKPLF